MLHAQVLLLEAMSPLMQTTQTNRYMRGLEGFYLQGYPDQYRQECLTVVAKGVLEPDDDCLEVVEPTPVIPHLYL